MNFKDALIDLLQGTTQHVLQDTTIDLSRFSQLDGSQHASDTPLTFIDGGSQSLFQTNALEIGFVRIAAVTWLKTQRKQIDIDEYYVLLTKDKAQLFSIDGRPQRSYDCCVLDQVRRYEELRMASKFTTLVCLDGSLKTIDALEDSLLQNCEHICSVAKTSTLSGPSQKGLFRLTQDVKGAWISHNIGEEYIIKLHSQASHVFTFMSTKTVKDDCEKLMPYAKDVILLGYPYPLIDVDRLARVSNEEVAHYALQIQLLLNEYQELLDADHFSIHETLDSMQF